MQKFIHVQVECVTFQHRSRNMYYTELSNADSIRDEVLKYIGTRAAFISHDFDFVKYIEATDTMVYKVTLDGKTIYVVRMSVVEAKDLQ